jgi:hypothetical protein
MKYVKVKDKNNLERDMNSNGIVNTDTTGYENYLQNYTRKYNETQRIVNLENDVNEIKTDLTEIKTLLRSLVNGSI